MGRGGSGLGGPDLGNGSEKPPRVLSQTDVWSYRHRRGNEPFVDSINSSARAMEDDFPGFMGTTVQSVNAARLGGADAILGFYDSGSRSVSLNAKYTDVEKMNSVYDRSVTTGFHPGRGNKNGTEAVSYHELGHALTTHIGDKMGISDFDGAARQIVENAYRNSGGKGGTRAWAKKISGYATHSNAECIAEAVTDWYCNGSKASAQSKAIMSELKRYA